MSYESSFDVDLAVGLIFETTIKPSHVLNTGEEFTLNLLQSLNAIGSYSNSLSIIEGSLPAGLSYNSTSQTFYGTATEKGSVLYNFTSTDSENNIIFSSFELTSAIPKPAI